MSSLPGFTSIKPLGSGGLGDVFYAVRVSTQSPVAIKVLRDWTDRSTAWHRAQRELEALRRLKGHANVIQLEEVTVAGGVPHIVMEFARGKSVDALLAHTNGRLDLGQVVLVGEQTASALVASHGLGIFHLDIKPQNLLISAFGQIKVCDFGISALTTTDQFRHHTSAVSYRYASPEQLDDADNVGAPSDVYALGATLTHVLTGAPRPSRGTDATVQRPLVWDLPDGLDESVRGRLDELLRLCMSPNPSDRPTAEQVLCELESIAAVLGPARCRALPDISDPTIVAPPATMRAPGPRPAPPGTRWPPGTSGPKGAVMPPRRPGAAGPPGRTGRQRTATTGRMSTGARDPTARQPTTRSGPSTNALAVKRGLFGVAALAAVGAGAILALPPILDRDATPDAATNASSAVSTPTTSSAAAPAAVTAATSIATSPIAASPGAPAPVPNSPDDQALAAQQLNGFIAADEPVVRSVLNNWMPQLASMGPETDGGYRYRDLVNEYQLNVAQWNAAIIFANDYFHRSPGFYVTVIPQPFPSADAVLDWCRANGLDNDHCGARYVTQTDPGFSIVKYQGE